MLVKKIFQDLQVSLLSRPGTKKTVGPPDPLSW